MNNIIKLSNGDTIVAEIIHKDSKVVCVMDPLSMEVVVDDGRHIMVSKSWVPLHKKDNMVTLYAHNIVAIADVDDETDRYYRKSIAYMKGDVEMYEDDLEDEDPLLDLAYQQSANTVH